MYQIRRALLSRTGYHNAWYDGVVIPFFKDESPGGSDPENTILVLPNGGGKTSLLSLLLSVFEPRADRFVQFLQNKQHHFDSYFSTEPGFVVLELQGSASGELFEHRLIIGQYVQHMAGRDRPDRIFFLFRPNDRLSFDTMPLRGLADPANELTTKQDVLAWMQRATADNPTFVRTENQGSWAEHLREHGVDTKLVNQQVTLNGIDEGGIKHFTQFTSEEQFLERFFDLTLPQPTTEPVLRELDQVLDQHAQYPEKLERRNVLGELLEGYRPLAEAAGRYRSATEARDARLGAVFGVEQALRVRRIEAEQQATTAAQDRAAAQREVEQAESHLKTLEARCTRLNGYLLRQRLAAATRAHTAARSDEAAARHGLALNAAASAHRELDAATLSHRNAAESLRRATEQLAPDHERLAQTATAFRYALRERITDLDAQIAACDTRVKEARRRADALSAERNTLHTKRVAVEGDARAASERLKARDEALDRLRTEGLIPPEMTPEDAVAALDARLGRLATETEETKDELTRIREERAGHEAERLRLTGQRSALDTHLSHAEQHLQEGSTRAKDLAADPAVARHAEGRDIDPADPGVLHALEARLAADRAQEQKLRARIDGLIEKAEHIRTHRLAPPLESSARLLEHLRGRGVTSADHYPTWIAETLPDAERARALVESDPARFLGLRLYAEQDIDALRGLDIPDEALEAPVHLSVVQQNPEAPRAGHLTLGPRAQERYNYAAAARLLENLDEESETLTRRRESLTQWTRELSAAVERLQDFQRTFGGTALDQAARRVDELTRQRAATDAAIESNKQASESLIQREDEASEHIQELHAEASRLGAERRTLHRHIEDHERPAAGHRERLRACEARIQSIHERLECITEELLREHEEQERARTDAGPLTAARQEFVRERSAITDGSDETPEPLPSSALETLREAYQDAVRQLRHAQSEHGVDLLAWEDEQAAKRLTAARTHYQEASRDLAVEEIEALLRTEPDLDAHRQRMEEARTAALEAIGAHNAAQQSADAALRDFTRQHPSADTETPPEDAVGIGIDDCRALLQRTEASRTQASEHLTNCRGELNDTGRRLDRAQELLRTLETAGQVIRITDTDRACALDPVPVDLPEDARAITHCATEAMARLSEASEDREARRAEGESLLKRLRRLVADNEHAPRNLREALASSTFVEEAARAAQHLERIAERLEAVDNALADMAHDIEIAKGQLLDLLQSAIRELDRAVHNVRIPAAVPHYGGHPILTMSVRLKEIPRETRVQMVDGYIQELMSTGQRRSSGSKLCTDLLVRAVGLYRSTGLGLKIIKIQFRSVQYEPVAKMTGSGGEGMATAMLIYFILAQMRAVALTGRPDTRTFLLLDNPFANLNYPEFLHLQVRMAAQCGIQLLFTTGLLDYNSLAEYAHLVGLHRARRDRANERTHLAVGNWWQVDEQRVEEVRRGT